MGEALPGEEEEEVNSRTLRLSRIFWLSVLKMSLKTAGSVVIAGIMIVVVDWRLLLELSRRLID